MQKENGREMYGVVESSVNGGCCAESSEEELSVLPRHTKVLVTGNNRTKSVLVGLQGVVKKAVGLGGWHWLVLTNGIEVKLQRNALSVIEAPTGQEEDEDTECENMQWNIGALTSDNNQKPHRPRHRPHKTIGSPHKIMSRADSCDSQYREPISHSEGATKVDVSKLETEALWRYWRHFNLPPITLSEGFTKTGQAIGSRYSLFNAVHDQYSFNVLVEAIPNPSKEELIDTVQRHFVSQVIIGFVQAAKRLKSVCS